MVSKGVMWVKRLMMCGYQPDTPGPYIETVKKKDEKVDCINFTPTSVFLMPASSNQVFLNASNCLLTSSFCNLHWLSIAMFLLKFCTNLILSTHAALIKQNKKQCLNLELTRQCNISFLKRPKTNQARPLSLWQWKA